MYGARIRYVKHGEEALKSLRSFEGMTVHLYPTNKSFILLTETGIVYESQVKGGLHKLKMAAKAALEERGVLFNEEKRKERKPKESV